MESAQQTIQEPMMPVELQYLYKLIKFRLGKYFGEDTGSAEPAIPELTYWQPSLAAFIRQFRLNKMEALTLLVALAPHIQPDLFDSAIDTKMKGAGDFPKIGGIRGKNFRGFLPTGETVLFLLADGNYKARQEVQQLFWSDHLFGKKKILWLEELPSGEPAMSGRLIMSQDYIDIFTYGKPVPPHFSMSFPAKKINTDLTWSDLVINEELKEQIKELLDWVKYNDQLMQDWDMHSRLRKGYRTLFYGPPGTGKTFTAGLLGKYTNKEVYKIDLSMVVSKYIGETEKNLELLFARAEDKGWILFFDEADALFGKRTNVRDAHDKYANQEVSYLLQRIEDYNGLIILATNMKNNIDDAFIRRFNSILKFPFPEAAERSIIWSKAFPKEAAFFKQPVQENGKTNGVQLEPANIPDFVKKYELTGGSIMNIIHYASLKAVERRNNKPAPQPAEATVTTGNISTTAVIASPPAKLNIYLTDVLDGIRREMVKEGKPFAG